VIAGFAGTSLEDENSEFLSLISQSTEERLQILAAEQVSHFVNQQRYVVSSR
jgi:hypothetical protein